MKILTAAEMREVDRLTTVRYRVPSLTLMENAGRSVAEFIQSRFPNLAKRRIVVLCGKGNNGGDGFVVARHLRKLRAQPEVYLVGNAKEVNGDAATNLNRWKKAGRLNADRGLSRELFAKLPAGSIIVDALLGTGVRGEVAGRLREVINAVNEHEPGIFVVSVDIPSGLQADTGKVEGAAIVADYTVTFTAPKPGLILGEGGHRVGRLEVRPIGSPPELIEELGKGNLRSSSPAEFVQFTFPRKAEGNKGDYGHALVVAGSVGKSGAAVLASTAALRAGAGLVTVATPEPVLPIIASMVPELMTEPLAATRAGTISERSLEGGLFAKLLSGKRALAIGPGLTTNDETQAFVRNAVSDRSVPIILDADGLNAFAGRASELRNPAGHLCITPHPGEMARLLGCSVREVQARRVEVAAQAARDCNALVVLKGHQTVTASPDGAVFINSSGSPAMATGGTGDVLTGMLAGYTAQFGTTDWLRVIAFGVYMHGLAGDEVNSVYHGAPLIASDLIAAVRSAYLRLHIESRYG